MTSNFIKHFATIGLILIFTKSFSQDFVKINGNQINYEKKENGSFGAIAGKHDDVLITRMAGLHICYELPLPVLQDKLARSKKKIVVGESTF